MRQPIPQRLRFEIFKRDGFRCIYCGNTPVNSKLHVDHVKPVAEGGTNAPENLVTACDACNGGKGAVPLDKKRFEVGKVTEADLDHAQQIQEWLALQRDVTTARDQVLETLTQEWDARCRSFHPGLRATLRKALEDFDFPQLLEAFDIVASKDYLRGYNDHVRYFNGILKQWRKEGKTRATQPPAPAPAKPVATRHVERCQRAVRRAMGAIAANRAAFPDAESQRKAVLLAFTRAAWGSLKHFRWVEEWWSQDRHSVRGLALDFNSDGTVSVFEVPDFSPHQEAWEETDMAAQFAIVERAKGDDAQALKLLMDAHREMRLWLTLFTETQDPEGAVEFFRSRPEDASILAQWEVE